ncbi:GCN5-related N-acetyltransferase [Scytonema sp. HK-05]|uniref:GNAT family N-acetyltransferase n=1 Tax=Scytonema sp. HK-05 TaxID=1137095 RepID=UPI0009376DEB|nr:GNAT family N-acetyltransferase [Scytonema sp. HK-05]OKH59804.1 GNAT family N-acetyltransferase [Scytonema sp. HK-05]BAY43126.1 GCN5-related N-acetyltransferase [Scytonema sp. HK-05]
MSKELLPGYKIRRGSTLDKALLVKFMQRTYQEAYPQQDFSHLARTVEQYFSNDTPVWWVDFAGEELRREGITSPSSPSSPVACLWVGNAIDQVQGTRHAHIFLLYVVPEHRQRGIGTALMRYVEDWAKARGDHQIGLQVFQSNTAALNLYNQLGYQTQSLWMVKSLDSSRK